MQKGMTIVSEALLAIGIIMVSMAFVLVGGNIVGFQTSGLFQSSQNQISEEISDTIREMPDASAQFSTTYRPGVETYELQVQEGRTITADVPEAGSSSTEFLNYNIQNTVIRNAEEICIQKKSDQVTLERGRCASPDLDEFCENGRCINDICQPDRGETCANSGGDCKCPDDAESSDASSFCKPDYRAKDFINAPGNGDGNVDTVDNQCVNESFVGVQGKGKRCSEDFECKRVSGARMSCSDPVSTSSISGEYCCPDGKAWDPNAGSSGQCVTQDIYDVVYVPVKMDSGDGSVYTSVAQNTQQLFQNSGVFESCSTSPSAHADKTVVPIGSGGACDITSCSDLSRNGNCFEKIEDCADQQVGTGNYERVMGICDNEGGNLDASGWNPGECEVDSGYTELCGKSKDIPADSAITFTNNACQAGRGEPIEQTAVHELGHTFGLPHVNICRDPAPSPNPSTVSPSGVCEANLVEPVDPNRACFSRNEEDCSDSPNKASDYLMTYATGHNIFGPDGLEFLKNSEFSSYRWGCSP